MARYAVGDIQGCFEPLQCLLESAKFGESDELWVVGDLVNRGPDSLQTLRFLKGLGSRCKVVLGNHDLHLLAIAHEVQAPRGADTLAEVLAAPDCDELLHWLQQQPLIYSCQASGYTMVHAGIPPMWSLKKAQRLAGEVERVLRGPQAALFFENMYGNQPGKWSGELSGVERWRAIVNYLTRMRFCTAAGELDLEDKASTRSDRPGFLPWFAHKKRKTRDDQLLFGHWAALEGQANADNVVALDTGCVWGRYLTLYCLDDQSLWQCDCSP